MGEGIRRRRGDAAPRRCPIRPPADAARLRRATAEELEVRAGAVMAARTFPGSHPVRAAAHQVDQSAERKRSMSRATEVRPFRVDVPEEELVDLRRRLSATRWPQRETVVDASQGVQ